MGIFALEGFQPELQPGCWVADDAVVVGRVKAAKNVNIWFKTVIRGDADDILIGENTNIQDACVLHTDAGFRLEIGANVTIGHRVVLHGCRIGDDTLVGIGSVVLNGARIGCECIVGANTLITENKIIPDRSLVMGSPARVIRTLSEEEIKKLRLSAAHYVENAQRFNNGLRRFA